MTRSRSAWGLACAVAVAFAAAGCARAPQAPPAATAADASADRYVIAPRPPAGATVREGQRLDVFVPEGHALSVTGYIDNWSITF